MVLKETGKNKIITFLITCFLIVCIFFPGDPYNLKLIFLFLSYIVGINSILKCIFSKKYKFFLAFGIIFPAFLMIQSFLLTRNLGAAISGAYSPFILLLLPIVIDNKIDYEKIFIRLMATAAFVLIILLLLDIIGFYDVNGNNFIRNSFYKYGIGFMGKSPDYALYYKIYLKSSALFVISIPYWFKKNNYIMATIMVFALAITGARANLFTGIAVYVFGFFYFEKASSSNLFLRLFMTATISIMVLLFAINIIEMVNTLNFTAGAVVSDEIRSKQLQGFLELFSQPKKLIFGEGFGSLFFDYGRNEYLANSEIAYFDLLRKVGLIGFIPLMYFIIKIFCYKINIHAKIALLAYLLICTTNPLLFSSTAYIYYVYLYFMVYNEQYVGCKQYDINLFQRRIKNNTSNYYLI